MSKQIAFTSLLLLLLLAAEIHCSPSTLEWVVKPPVGKTQLGNQDLPLALRWVLMVLLSQVDLGCPKEALVLYSPTSPC